MSSKFLNEYYKYGIITFDFGVVFLLIGGIGNIPALMGFATGFLIVGVGCFIIGGINENK